MTIQQAVRDVVAGKSLTEDEAYGIACAIMAGEVTAAQIAALLVGLRMKGETVTEILGFVRAMRARMTSVRIFGDNLIDTCGTGGDTVVRNGVATGTFNVSTVAAFVAAGAGCRVAKHGNRAISSRCGSADVLRALGLPVEMSAETSARCIEEIGVGFLFAPLFHHSLKHAVKPRREVGIRTILNIVGPLANPAGARRQLVGVYDGCLTEPLARVLLALGSTHCMLVHGDDGLDEISLSGPTRVSELRNGQMRTYTLHPNEFGLSTAGLTDIQGGDSKVNAEIAMRVLSRAPGPARDIVLLNAGAAIYVSGRCDSMSSGVTAAAESIDSGQAIGKLRALRERTLEATA
ncbi:MAG: anthranilate phosphoribosyltransferase [Phycisphaerales bacterium]|nr:MAG: anthranilate phosphoribosyltransferase [Phycisphaerales bacterium]